MECDNVEDKIYDLLTILHNDIKDLKQGQNNLENRFDNLEKKVDSIDKTVVRIENENHIQHTALFDGWKQNTQQLERIEKEVTKQEEIIMRRIK